MFEFEAAQNLKVKLSQTLHVSKPRYLKIPMPNPACSHEPFRTCRAGLLERVEFEFVVDQAAIFPPNWRVHS